MAMLAYDPDPIFPQDGIPNPGAGGNAAASTAADGAGGDGTQTTDQPEGMNPLWIMLAMVAVFYFLLIRPGAKQQKERKAMLEALKKGDVVMTQGGIIGEVVMLDEQRVKLKVAKDVRMQFSRQAIQAVIEDKDLVADDAS